MQNKKLKLKFMKNYHEDIKTCFLLLTMYYVLVKYNNIFRYLFVFIV